jgi:hypothetical protein
MGSNIEQPIPLLRLNQLTLRFYVKWSSLLLRQKDTARANESFQMRLQLLTRIIKNCESLKKINLTPNADERFINIKRLNLELFWQLFKVDAGILL